MTKYVCTENSECYSRVTQIYTYIERNTIYYGEDIPDYSYWGGNFLENKEINTMSIYSEDDKIVRIGIFKKDCFIEYNEWIAINRDKQINEILND